MRYAATYFCNLNLQAKFFDGFQPERDALGLVGTVVVEGETPAHAAEAAFRAFNRIDAPVPVLDKVEAPSMSVGDVLHLAAEGGDESWHVVASFGFDEIPQPHGTKCEEFTPGLMQRIVDEINGGRRNARS